jgi:hypothetical protein
LMGHSSLSRAASLADAGPGLEKREFSARETTIMHEFVAHSATGPTATNHRLISIQALLADFAVSRLDREQHWLPIATSFPDAHGTGV